MSRPWSVNKSRRTEAAIACYQMASSNDKLYPDTPAFNIGAQVVGKPPIIALAIAAFDAVSVANQDAGNPPYDNVREWWAEAGQLIEDGWTPGDQIVMMKDKLEAELEKQVEAQHDEMNAAGVPADAETSPTIDDETPVANDDMTAAHEDFDIQASSPIEDVIDGPAPDFDLTDAETKNSADDLYVDPPTDG